MDRLSVIAALKHLEPNLKARGVAALFLFGSFARDEAGPDSDIDLLVEPGNAHFGFVGAMDAAEVVERAIPNRAVSLVTRNNIVSHYLPFVEASAIRVF